MRNLLITKEEQLDLEIKEAEYALNLLKKRQGRKDKGEKRTAYKSDLPPKYRSYLNRANKKKIAFELSVEDFDRIQQSSCAYCGSYSKLGIDRKDSSEGYTLDNCQPCCAMCNMMKYVYSEDAFLKQVQKIYSYRKTQH